MAVLSSIYSVWLLPAASAAAGGSVLGGICLLGQFCPNDLGGRSSWINLAV